jgi:soluble lytic murein transglycosylase
MKGSARRRGRRLQLAFGIGIPAVILVAVVILVVAAMAGRVVVPGISGKVYPIKYQSEIETVAQTYHMDPYLVAAVARTESGFNPTARSGAGALGLMQLLPDTADWVTTFDSWKGPKEPVLTDPKDNLELGTCYLSYLLHRFDTRVAAIAAYNAGPNRVASWIEKAGGADSFTAADIPYKETRDFVSRVDHWQQLFKKAHPNAFVAAAAPFPAGG